VEIFGSYLLIFYINKIIKILILLSLIVIGVYLSAVVLNIVFYTTWGNNENYYYDENMSCDFNLFEPPINCVMSDDTPFFIQRPYWNDEEMVEGKYHDNPGFKIFGNGTMTN